MAKTGDFGGLPSSVFTTVVATFSTPGGSISDADKIKVLAMLAQEEHAAANSTDFDTIEVVMTCIEVKEMHALIATGAAPAGTITSFVTLLNALQKLWKS